MESLKRLRSSLKVPHTNTESYMDDDYRSEIERPRKRLRIVPERLRRTITPSDHTVEDEVEWTSQSAVRQGFRFLDLPGEIRTLFYEHVFIKRPMPRCQDAIIDVRGIDFWERPPYGDFYVWTHPLLRTNSQIRYEGLDTYFKQNRFKFMNECNMNVFLHTIGSFGCERIRSVTIESLPRLWFGERTYGPFEWTRIENYMRMLARLPNLRSLCVERSPYYFQERVYHDADDDDDSDDEEETWYPDIQTLDPNDALRTAYLGWMPLHIRGLEKFSIIWTGLGQNFDAKQRSWFEDVERRIRAVVTQPKPDKYFQNRTKFLQKGYDAGLHVTWARQFKYKIESAIPRQVSYALSRPSDFFSTYAFDHEEYERQQKWPRRRQAVYQVLDDCWWNMKHPVCYTRALKSHWRNLRSKGTTDPSYYYDPVDFLAAPAPAVLPPLPALPIPPPSSQAAVHPPPVPSPAVIVPTPGPTASPQQAVLHSDDDDWDIPSTPQTSISADSSQSDPDRVLAVTNGDDDDSILLESLTDGRASGSLPSLLRVLNID